MHEAPKFCYYPCQRPRPACLLAWPALTGSIHAPYGMGLKCQPDQASGLGKITYYFTRAPRSSSNARRIAR